MKLKELIDKELPDLKLYYYDSFFDEVIEIESVEVKKITRKEDITTTTSGIILFSIPFKLNNKTLSRNKK
jgi:hypothetical protein